MAAVAPGVEGAHAAGAYVCVCGRDPGCEARACLEGGAMEQLLLFGS